MSRHRLLLTASGSALANLAADDFLWRREDQSSMTTSLGPRLERLGPVPALHVDFVRLAAEEPSVRWWTVDPGDMRTQMHQDAFPGQDISDRPLPESVVPAFLALLDERPPSGRYRATELVPANAGV